MLLKKYYRIASEKFTRITFDEDSSMNMCAGCYFTESCTSNSLSYSLCKKVNFDGLLYSERFKYAYVVKKT